jgi:asparagine synthase (glutamine-hydrolysing)
MIAKVYARFTKSLIGVDKAMSAFGGIYNFSGEPVDEQMLSRIGAGLVRRGPDGLRLVNSGCLGLVYRPFHTNLESRLETQPFVTKAGQILCWDGRLDNREQLISDLQNELTDDRTDVAIVMSAYRKCGFNFAATLIGDFALALWEPETNALVLARDFVGARTLYYHIDRSRIIWSTALPVLIEMARVSMAIDDEYVAGFVTKLPTGGLTPYRHFKSVPPGHAVIIEKDQCRTSRFWQPNPGRETRYKSDSEYEEHFRYLFTESVCCRLRAEGSVWAELSGGLDSSPIVCVANQLRKQGKVQAKTLETVSRVYDEAGKSDERKFIKPVETKIGKAGLHLREDDHRLLAAWPDDYVPCIPSHVANFSAYYRALNKAMKLSGSRVLLSGFGGDELQLGDGEPFPELVDLLLRCRFGSLYRSLRAWSASQKDPYWRFAWRSLLSPLLPKSLQLSRQKVFTKLLEFYNPDFVERMCLRDRLFGSQEQFKGATPGFKYRANYFLYTTRQLSAGFWQELCDIEFSYPFTYKPLVEFMLSVPAAQHARPNQSKSLLRRALRDLLPSELVERSEGRITIWHAASLAVRRELPRIRTLISDAGAIVDSYINRQAVLSTCDKTQPDVLLLPLIPFVQWLESFAKLNSHSLSTSVKDSIAA